MMICVTMSEMRSGPSPSQRNGRQTISSAAVVPALTKEYAERTRFNAMTSPIPLPLVPPTVCPRHVDGGSGK